MKRAFPPKLPAAMNNLSSEKQINKIKTDYIAFNPGGGPNGLDSLGMHLSSELTYRMWGSGSLSIGMREIETFENLVGLSILGVLSNFSEKPDNTTDKFGIEA